MSIRLPFAIAIAGLAAAILACPSAAEVTALPNEHGLSIKIDGQPFADYWTRAGSKPVVWPIIGPTGKPMTRFYPMGEGVNEKKDHIHQRSLWFTHGIVNDIDFWAEESKDPKHKLGIIVHKGFVSVTSGPAAVVVTRNDWVGPDGKRVCADQRRLAFGTDGTGRWIDFDIVLSATDGPVVFGDTKEGAFGMRVAETLKVDAKQGGKIVDSEGRADKDAWGQTASWVDYYGPVDGQVVGITIFNHPDSFRYPTHWHVRTYGLFAANPFGLKDFPGSKGADGALKLDQSRSIHLFYRVLFHKGDEREGKVAEMWSTYAKQPRPKMPSAQ